MRIYVESVLLVKHASELSNFVWPGNEEMEKSSKERMKDVKHELYDLIQFASTMKEEVPIQTHKRLTMAFHSGRCIAPCFHSLQDREN